MAGDWQRLNVTKGHIAGWRRAAVLVDRSVLVTTRLGTDLFRDGDQQHSEAGSMVVRRSLPELVTLPDGRVLAIGGYAPAEGSPVLASCELFDPANGTWRLGPQMTVPRLGAAAALVGGRVLVIGGCDAMSGGRILASVEAWTPGDDEWVPLTKLPRPCPEPRAVVLADGSILVVDGGAWTWDPSREAWRTSEGGPARTVVALAARAAGGAIVIGGREGDRDVATVDVLDADGAWRPGKDLAESRADAEALELADGRIIVVGGSGTRFTTPNTDLLYEWESDYRDSAQDLANRDIPAVDAEILSRSGAWTTQRIGKLTGARLVRLDASRVVVADLSQVAIWTP